MVELITLPRVAGDQVDIRRDPASHTTTVRVEGPESVEVFMWDRLLTTAELEAFFTAKGLDRKPWTYSKPHPFDAWRSD